MGWEMFKHACKTGLEGVVSKVRDSSYPHGRSNDDLIYAGKVDHGLTPKAIRLL
jgi:ATP-dependent DNA ligase